MVSYVHELAVGVTLILRHDILLKRMVKFLHLRFLCAEKERLLGTPCEALSVLRQSELSASQYRWSQGYKRQLFHEGCIAVNYFC